MSIASKMSAPAAVGLYWLMTGKAACVVLKSQLPDRVGVDGGYDAGAATDWPGFS